MIPKGAYSGECLRTACTERPALYWNPNHPGFYCVRCARKLNKVFKHDGLPLISMVPDRPSDHPAEGATND